MSARGTSNTNTRGSAASRRRRREWLLETFGDGTSAPCFFCGAELTVATLTVDRIVPGCLGGRYVRGNIRPACIGCNAVDGVALRERLKVTA
jgi:hypothetical protein